MGNTDFKISSARILSTTEKWSVSFRYDFKKWSLTIEVKNGVIGGNYNSNVATSDLDYFRYDDDIRKQHFDVFKEAIMAQKQES